MPNADPPDPDDVTDVEERIVTCELVTGPARCTPKAVLDDPNEVRPPPTNNTDADESALEACRMYEVPPTAEMLDADSVAVSVETGMMMSNTVLSVVP